MPLNMEAVNKTLALMEAAPENQFQMGVYLATPQDALKHMRVWATSVPREPQSGCGAVGCIAGFVVMANTEQKDWEVPRINNSTQSFTNNEGMSVTDRAAEILGLSAMQEHQLFLPTGADVKPYAEWTKAEGIAHFKNIIQEIQAGKL